MPLDSLNCSFRNINCFTYGLPWVNVPVLSNTIVVIEDILSSISAPLMSIPKVAATPVPTITAVGVANPKAHGHAMTNVDMPKLNAN